MNSSSSTWIQKHSLVLYFVLAYAITWVFELPLAAVQQGWTSARIPFAIHYLGAFGPMLAALILTGLTQGSPGVRALFGRLLQWRVGWPWWLFCVGSPIVMFALAAVVMQMTTGQWPDLALLGDVEYLPYLGIAGALVLWFVTWGAAEEIGWRGFALPRLQRSRTALSATLILGVLHALWHLPALFYKPTYMTMGFVVGLILLVVSVVSAAVVFTWIYNSTGGSVLMVAIFHALFDMLSVSKAGGTLAPSIMSAVVWVLAPILILLLKPANLSRQSKQVE